MLENAKRRNGSDASCEPCRRAKTRCDHSNPTCLRCRRRGPGTRCWYHPAPLTQRSRLSKKSAVLNPGNNVPQLPISPARATIPPSGRAQKIGLSGPITTLTSDSQVSHYTTRDANLADIIDVLDQLRNWPTIEQTVRIYLSKSAVPISPVPLTLQILSTINDSELVASYRSDGPHSDKIRAARLHHAETILQSSASEVTITPSTSVFEFCAIFNHPRIEMIGHLYAIAARGLCYRATHDSNKNDALMQELFRCSKLAQRLAYDLAPQSTDVMIWLAHENLQTLTLNEGDAGLDVWRRLGEIASEILALGFHREATHSAATTPFFLAEIRRRVFCSVYQYDKAYAELFDRPPRIPSRYVDCKPPLDLTDEQVLADTPEALEKVKSYVDEEGWNVQQIFSSTTWARIRYALGGFREELVEHYLGIASAPSDEQLEDLSIRCLAVRDNLPTHMQPNRELWSSDLSIGDIFMLGGIHLSYMKVEFHIHRLMTKNNPQNVPSLWAISARMLKGVLQMCIIREKDEFLPRDLPAIMYCHGIPCAAVIAAALHETSKPAPLYPLPPELNRAALIRNLSIFLSDLESICGPGSLNHQYCTQAAKAISATLDNVLNGTVASSDFSATMSPATPDVGSYATPASALPALVNSKMSGSLTGLEELASFDLSHFDFLNADLAGWSADLGTNWTAVAGEWNG